MNWIDEKRREFEMFTQFNDGSALDWFDNFAQEAHTKGTQEALAKVEEWVKDYVERWGKLYVDDMADDLLHHLQQLKDNNTV